MRTWSKLIVSYTKPLVAKLTKPRTYTHTEASQSVSKAYITPVTPKEAFGDLATRDLLRGLVALALARTPGVATYGGKFLESIHRSGPRILKDFVDGVVRRTVFGHFCAGETLDECERNTQHLRRLGVKCLFDYAAEREPGTVLSEEDLRKEEAAKEYAAELEIETIRRACQLGKGDFACIKITALAVIEHLEKLNAIIIKDWKKSADKDASIRGYSVDPEFSFDFEKLEIFKSHFSDEELRILRNDVFRIQRLCALAAESRVPILIDAEHYCLQDAIEYIAMGMQKRYNTPQESYVFTTIQCYLKDSERREKLVTRIAEQFGFRLGLKLVRGAYLHYEREYASQRNIESPVWNTIEETHRSYNTIASREIARVSQGKTSLILATHNLESIRNAIKNIEQLNMRHDNEHFHFGQLYSMADATTASLRKAGFQVVKYIPFGPLEEVIPYLSRRLLENQDILGSTSVDMSYFYKELMRRITRK
jgi:proline dehydrogenase